MLQNAFEPVRRTRSLPARLGHEVHRLARSCLREAGQGEGLPTAYPKNAWGAFTRGAASVPAGLRAPRDNAGLRPVPKVLAPVPAPPAIGPPEPSPGSLSTFANFPSPLPSLRGFTAIFGGSFDPPHRGHQAICDHLVYTMHADEVWLTPVYSHVDGKSLADFSHRVAMCEAMAEPYDGKVRVSLAEREHGMSSLTSTLLRYLKSRYPERRFAFTAGSDVANAMPGWEGWDYIAKTTPIYVIQRSGYENAGRDSAEKAALEAPMSSTEVRRRIAADEAIDDVVSEKVSAYLKTHRLYASKPEAAAA